MKLLNSQFFFTKKLYIEHVWLMLTLPMFIVFGIWAIQFSLSFSSPATYVSTYEAMPKEMFSQIHTDPKEDVGSYVVTSGFVLIVEVVEVKGFKKIFSGVGNEIHFHLPGKGMYLVKYTIEYDGKIFTTTKRKKVVKEEHYSNA